MIERGLLRADSDRQPETSDRSPGACAASTHSKSTLNRLLQAPVINKVNYVKDYKLNCTPSSHQKSVIRRGPSSSSINYEMPGTETVAPVATDDEDGTKTAETYGGAD